jgi:hypothetical protein
MNTTNPFVLAVFAAVLAVLGSTTVEVIKLRVLEPLSEATAPPVSIGGYQYANEAPGFTYADEAVGFTYADEAPSALCTPRMNRQSNNCHSP